MRALLLISAIWAVAGCTDTAVDQDTTYRRLRDQFSSEPQCLAEGNFTPCFQTLRLCPDRRASIDLDNSPQHGSYELATGEAIMTFIVMGTIHFDLDAATSPQLPGIHPWEEIHPTSSGCD